MPIPPRQFHKGGIYHIFNRGYEKRTIYNNNKDYLRFIESLFYFNDSDFVKIRDVRLIDNIGKGRTFLRDERRQKSWEPLVDLLAFTLMPNHFHLIIREIVTNGIMHFMHKIGTGFTGYYNTIYDRKGLGGIFQSRYKAVEIIRDEQLIDIFSYVHTNPVELLESGWKDFLVKNPVRAIGFLEKYWQSSYLDYIGQANLPNLTNREFFTELFGGEGECRMVIQDWIEFKAKNAILDEKLLID